MIHRFFILGALFFLAAPASAQAGATLLFSPARIQGTVGDAITVFVRISSPDEPMNAVSTEIEYDQSLVEVRSVSRINSRIDYWVREPSIESGHVRFEGLVLGDGFQGTGGDLVQLHLALRQKGDSDLVFRSSSVLANDGQGTNILTGVSIAHIHTESAKTTRVSPAEPPSNTTLVPREYETPEANGNASSTVKPLMEAAHSTGSLALCNESDKTRWQSQERACLRDLNRTTIVWGFIAWIYFILGGLLGALITFLAIHHHYQTARSKIHRKKTGS